MAHDGPELPDLVRTVRDFVQAVEPRLDGEQRYHALCSVYLLEIVERELLSWVPQCTDDDQRLYALADVATDQDVSTAVKKLCADIRAGRFDDELPTLHASLLAHVESKVRVSKPDFLNQVEAS